MAIRPNSYMFQILQMFCLRARVCVRTHHAGLIVAVWRNTQGLHAKLLTRIQVSRLQEQVGEVQHHL